MAYTNAEKSKRMRDKKKASGFKEVRFFLTESERTKVQTYVMRNIVKKRVPPVAPC